MLPQQTWCWRRFGALPGNWKTWWASPVFPGLAALAEAAFLVVADLLARVVMPPNELPVGILTALVGGPAFLLLLRRTQREYRF